MMMSALHNAKGALLTLLCPQMFCCILPTVFQGRARKPPGESSVVCGAACPASLGTAVVARAEGRLCPGAAAAAGLPAAQPAPGSPGWPWPPGSAALVANLCPRLSSVPRG